MTLDDFIDNGVSNSNGTYTLTGNITVNERLIITGNVTLNLNGHNITCTVDGDDYAFCVQDGGKFTLTGNGEIRANGGAGGIEVEGGSFTMNGGKIVVSNGRGVQLDGVDCSFTMSGGEISVTGGKDGVYNNGGTVTMSGGTINVTGTDSKGINNTVGTVTMSGGTINVTGTATEKIIGIYNEQNTVNITTTNKPKITVTNTGGGEIYTIYNEDTVKINGKEVTKILGIGITFDDDGNVFYEVTSANQLNALVGKTGEGLTFKLDKTIAKTDVQAFVAANTNFAGTFIGDGYLVKSRNFFYPVTVPETLKITYADETSVATFDGVTYYKQGASIIISAKDSGTVIKLSNSIADNNVDGTATVKVGNETVNITDADVTYFYSVTIPQGFEIDDSAVGAGYKYSVSGTTYYAKDTKLTLKVKQGYVVDGDVTVVSAGGDTVLQGDGGSYTFEVGGVTTINGTLKGELTMAYLIKADENTILGYINENGVFSDPQCTTAATNGFALVSGTNTVSVSKDALTASTTTDIYITKTDADGKATDDYKFVLDTGVDKYGSNICWTYTPDTGVLSATKVYTNPEKTSTANIGPSKKISAGFYVDYEGHIRYLAESTAKPSITLTGLPSAVDAGNREQYFTIEGYTLRLTQKAVDELKTKDFTLTTTGSYSFALDVNVTGIDKGTATEEGWKETSSTDTAKTFNYCSAGSTAGYTATANEFNYTSSVVEPKQLYGITVTGSTSITLDNVTEYVELIDKQITLNDAFVTALGNISDGNIVTVALSEGTTGYTLAANVSNNTPKTTAQNAATLTADNSNANKYTYSIGAFYDDSITGKVSFYGKATFTIEGLAADLRIEDGNIYSTTGDDTSTVLGTISFSENKLQIDLKKENVLKTEVERVTVTVPENSSYEVEYILTGVGASQSDKDNPTKVEAAGTDGIQYTAAKTTAGYEPQGNDLVKKGANSGGENFVIKGLNNFSDYTLDVNASGVITAKKDGETITVGTVTRTDGTAADGTTKTVTFTVALDTDAFDTTKDGTIDFTSNSTATFVLSGIGNISVSDSSSKSSEVTLTKDGDNSFTYTGAHDNQCLYQYDSATDKPANSKAHYVYQPATATFEYPQFTITGLSGVSETVTGDKVKTYITVENREVTILPAALGDSKPDIKFTPVDGYATTNLKQIGIYPMLAQGGAASDTITKGDNSYTYTTGAQKAGYYLDSETDKYVYQEAAASKSFTITGVDLSSLFTGETTTVDVSDTSKALISVDDDNKVTIGTNAVTDVQNASITFDGGSDFTLTSIAGKTIVTKSATPTLTKNEGADNSYTYSTGTQSEGFIDNGSGTYTYQKEITAGKSFTVTGLTGISDVTTEGTTDATKIAEYITVSNDNKVTIGTAAITGELSGASITFTGDGYELVSIAGINNIYPEKPTATPSLKKGATAGSYTYNTGTISEGFVNKSGTYTYQAQVAGTKITISGLKENAFESESINENVSDYITYTAGTAAEGDTPATNPKISFPEGSPLLPSVSDITADTLPITVLPEGYDLVLPESLTTATATTGTFETTDGKTFTLTIGGTPAHYNADGTVVQATGQGEVITLTASAAIESLLNTNFTVKKKDDGTYYIYKDGETGEGKELFTYKYDATATTPYQVKVATSVLEALPEGKYIKINTITSASGTTETVKNVGSLTWLDSNFATDHRTSKQEAIDVLTEEDKTTSFTVANVDGVAVGTFKKALANLDWYNQVYPYQVTHTAKSGGQNFQLSNLNAELIGKTFYVSGTSTDRIHEIRQDNASGTLIAVVTNGSILLSSNEQITLAEAAFKSTDATAPNEDRTITLIRSNDGFAHVITTGTVSAGTLPISTNSAAKMLSPNLEKAKDDNGNEISGSYVYTSSGKIAHITRSAVDGVNNLAATYQPSTITTMTLSGLSPNLATGGIGLDVLGYVEFNSLDALKEYMTLSFSTGSGTNTVKHVALASGYYKYTGTEDITLDSTLDITDANVILDLNGKTINYVGKGEDDQAVRVWENGHLTINNGTITATEADGIYLQPNTGETNDDGTPRASLILNNVNVLGTTYGVVGNGTCHGTAITINNSKITGGNTGIYHPQEGTLVINGTSEITGTTTGIEIRSGELYITGKEVKVNGGDGEYTVNGNGSGTTTANAAIAIAQHSTNKNLDINIEGGTFTATTALSLANPNGTGTSTVEVNIQGGTFAGNIVNKYADKPVNIGGETTCSGTLTVENSGTFAIDPAATLASNSSYSSYVAQESIEALKNIIAPQQEETGAVVVTKGEESGYIVKVNAKALKGATGNIKLVSSDGYSLALGEDVATAPFVVESEATFTVTDAKTLKFKSPSYKAWYKSDNGEYVPQAAVEGKEFTFNLTSDGTFTTADKFTVVTDETGLISTIYNADDVTVSMDGTVTPNTGAKSLFTFTVTGDNEGTYGDITAYGFAVEKAFLTAMGTADNKLTLAPPNAADGETAPTTKLALAENVGVESVDKLKDDNVLTKQITGQNTFVYTPATAGESDTPKLIYQTGSTPAYYELPNVSDQDTTNDLSITYHATSGGTEAFTLTGALNDTNLNGKTLTLTDKTVTVDGTEKTYKVLKAGETVIGAFGTGDSANVFYLAKDAFDATATGEIKITLTDAAAEPVYSLSSESIPSIDGLLPNKTDAAVPLSFATVEGGYKYQGEANGDYVSVKENVATFNPSTEDAKAFTISGLKDGLITGDGAVDKITIGETETELSELITFENGTVTLKNAALLPDNIAKDATITVTPGVTGTNANVTKLEFSGFGTGSAEISADTGGNFLSENKFKAPSYPAVFDKAGDSGADALTRKCIRAAVGGEEFTFTGVVDGLTFEKNDASTNATALVYDIKSGEKVVGTITVAVANNAITGYTFDLKPGAINVESGKSVEVSVEKTKGDTKFDFTITTEPVWQGGWYHDDATSNEYLFYTPELNGYAQRKDGDQSGKISYTYSATQESSQEFSIMLDKNITLTPIESDVDIGDASTIDSSKVVLGDIVRNADGRITSISVTLKEGALPADGFDTDTTVKLAWAGDSDYGDIKPTPSVAFDKDYNGYIKPTNSPATFEGTSGTYSFKARETSAGYTPDTENGTIEFTTRKGGDTFTISGLADNLTVVYDKTGKIYNIYAKTDVDENDKPTATATVLGTIEDKQSADGKPVNATVTIKSTAAIAGFNGDTAPTQTFQIILTDTDNENSLVKYTLTLDDSIKPTGEGTSASFTKEPIDGSNTAKYTYTPAGTLWKFDLDKNNALSGAQAKTSYTFTPAGFDTTFPQFSIDGLRSDLDDKTMALNTSTGVITAQTTGDNPTEVTIGTLSNGKLTITEDALKDSSGNLVDGASITAIGCTLERPTGSKAYNGGDDTKESFSYAIGTGTFKYTAAGNAGGYELSKSNSTLTYHAQSGAQSFELTGFNTSQITKITNSGSSTTTEYTQATFADITKDNVVEIFTVKIDGTGTGTVTLKKAAFDNDTGKQTFTITDNKEGDGVDYKLTSTLSTTGTPIAASTTVGSDLIYTAAGIGVYYTTTDTSVKRNAQQGREQFKLELPNNKTGFYVDSEGNIKATENDTEVLATITFDDVTVEAGKGVTEATTLKKPKTVAVTAAAFSATNDEVKLTNVTENLGVTLALAEGLKSAAETVAAKFGTGDDDKFTYTGAHDSAYYTLGEGSLSVKYTAEATGAQFKLTGFDTAKVTSLFVDNTSGKIYIGSDADGTEIGAVTISGSTGTVTLNETAFTYATDAATGITLVDLDKDDGVTFSFGQGDLTQESAATITEGFSFDNGTYTYTASGTKAYYTIGQPTTATVEGKTQTSTALTRTAQTGGQQFTISGLVEVDSGTNLTISGEGKISGTVGGESVDFGTLANNTLTIEKAAALAGGDIVLTNLAIGTSGAPTEINYKLAFGGEFSDTATDGKIQVIDSNATAPREGNKFQKTETDGTFTYQTEHGKAYVRWDANGADGTGTTEKTYTATYTAAGTNFDTITFTGLNYSGDDFTVGDNTAVTYDENSNVFTLTSAVLPTTGDITISAKQGNTDTSADTNYTMAVTDVATKPYQLDNAATTPGNTWSSGVYTSPAFATYYTYADSDTTSTSKITVNEAIPAAEVFTVNKKVGDATAAGLGSYYVAYNAENQTANIFVSQDDTSKVIGTITFTPAASGGKDTYAVNFTKAHIESQLNSASATAFTATAKDNATVNFTVDGVTETTPKPEADAASLKAKAASTTEAEYTGGHTNAYWTVTTNSYTYTPEVENTVFFTIGGLKSNSNLDNIKVTHPTAQETNYTIALTKDYFTVGTPVTITPDTANATITSITDGGDNYFIQKDDPVPQVSAAFTSTDSGATYNFKSAYPAEHIVADGNNYTLTAADETKALTFTISGLNADYANADNYTLSVGTDGTIIATPKEGTEGTEVTIGTLTGDATAGYTLTLNEGALSKEALAGTASIELTSTADANFSLAINKTDGGTFALEEPTEVNKLAYDSEKGYTYTAGYVGEHFASQKKEGVKFSYTYTGEISTGQFTISGTALKTEAFTGEITTKDNKNALDSYLTVDEDGKVTNVGMLKDEPDANDTVSIAVAKGTYTLANPQAVKANNPTFVPNDKAFDYKASTEAGYAENPAGTFTYQPANEGTVLFSISGLPTTITALTLDGEKLMSGTTQIGTFSGKEIKLNSNAVTTAEIKLENNSDQYTLGVDSTVTQAAFTPVKDGTYTFTGDATSGFTFSTPAYQTYYVVSDNTITQRPALDAQSFTITVAGDFNADSLTLGEPVKGDEGYTFTIEGFGTVTATATAGTGSDSDTFTFTAVTPDKDFIGRLGQGGTLTISGGTFSATDLPEADVKTGDATFEKDTVASGATQTYTYTAPITTADKYTVNGEGNQITHSKQEGGEQFKLSGDLSDGFKALTTVDTTYFNVDNGKVYLTKAAFSAADKSITLTNPNGANFAFATDNKDYLDEYSNTNSFEADFTGSGNGTLAYKAGGLNDGLTFSGTKATYKAGTGGQKFVISGVDSTITADNLSIENGGVISSGGTAIAEIDSSNKVTLKKDALADGTVKFEDGTDTETYSLALDKSLLSATTTAGAVSEVKDSTVTYVTTAKSAYYTATSGTANSFDYVAADGGDTLTISGLTIDTENITKDKIGDYISIVENGTEITVTINSTEVLTEDTGTEVTLSTLTGYTLTLEASDDVLKQTTETTGKWMESGDAYTYSYITTTTGYTLDGNKLVYKSYEEAKTTNISLTGLTSEPTNEKITVDNGKKTVTFNANLGDVTISSADSYKFTAAEGMKLTGTNDADTLTATGSNVSLDGGAGNDTFDFSNATGGVLAFSDGNDTVEYSANFKINFDSKTYDPEATAETIKDSDGDFFASLSGDDVVFSDESGNTLTVKNARGKAVTIVDSTKVDQTVKLNKDGATSMLTYDGVRRTAVTLNGTAQAASDTAELFTGNLNSGDYAGTVVTITAAAGANYNKGISIEGNAKSNVIISQNTVTDTTKGNTINGGEGNDSLTGVTGANDTFIFKESDVSNDVITNYEAGDVLQIEGGEGNITPNITGNNIVFRVGTYSLTLRDVLSSAESIVVTVKNENGEAIEGLSGYTYYKNSGVLASASKVRFTSSTTAYTVTANDKEIDASLASASVVTIDMTNAANGLTINGFKPTFKLTGYEASNIYSCSYDESTGTFILGLSDNGTKVDKIITLVCRENNFSNQLNIGTETVYIGENALYNAKSSARTVSLTSAFSGTFDAAGEMQDKFSANTTLSIDASRTKGVTLVGGQYGNTLTGSKGNDEYTGAEGVKDTFFYYTDSDSKGGADYINDYEFGTDVISLSSAKVLGNFKDISYDSSNNITINGSDGNALTITEADGQPITFNIGGKVTTYTFSGDGELNADRTAITLRSGYDKTDFNKESKYPSLASIYAGGAINKTEIYANDGINSYITAGNVGLTLVGGSGNDTLQDGTGDSSLTGNAGNDTFIVGGGNDTITDYGTGDVINLKTYSMSDITGVTEDSGTTLTFKKGDSTHKLTLTDVTGAVTIDGTAYTFNTENNTVNDTANGRVTVLGSNQNINLATDATYQGTKYIMANNGGTITAASGNVTLGGKDVSLVGGPGSDVFVYAGGNATISSYSTSGNDRISLASGYSVANVGIDKDGDGKDIQRGLTIADSAGTTVGYIYIEGDVPNNSVRVMNSSGGEKTFYLSNTGVGDIFSTEKPEDATSVIVQSHVGDYGSTTDKTDGTNTALNGTEHFNYMFQVEASQENSFLTGNYRNNTIIAKGGKYNILTGGLGNDTFVFNVGGGVIRDFGIGTTKDGTGKTLASTPTTEGYDRRDPMTYYEGSDTLRVKGKVVDIAFKGYETSQNAVTKKTPHGAFTAYVTYTSDEDGEDYTVVLDNILKKPTTTSTTESRQRFSTDNVAVKSLTIYDTSSGDFAKLSSDSLLSLLSSADDTSAYYTTNSTTIANIDELKQFVSNDRFSVAEGATYNNDSATEFTEVIKEYQKDPYSESNLTGYTKKK